MGIKNLNKLLTRHCKDGISEINIKELSGNIVAIDTSIYLYKYKYFGNILDCFTRQIIHLLKNKITPIYLFDGKPTEEKNKLLIERSEKYRKQKEEINELKENIEDYIIKIKTLKEDETNNDVEKIEDLMDDLSELRVKLNSKSRSSVRVTKDDYKNLKQMFEDYGIFYYTCNGETDIYMKHFFNNNLIDYALTEDLDFLTHGCNKVLYNYNFKKNKILLYDCCKIKKELELNDEQFIDLCIMMGCDYTKSPKGIGYVTSYKLIKKYEAIENVIENIDKYNYDNFDYINARKIFLIENETIDLSRRLFTINPISIKTKLNISPKLIFQLEKILKKGIKQEKKTLSLKKLIKKS